MLTFPILPHFLKLSIIVAAFLAVQQISLSDELQRRLELQLRLFQNPQYFSISFFDSLVVARTENSGASRIVTNFALLHISSCHYLRLITISKPKD